MSIELRTMFLFEILLDSASLFIDISRKPHPWMPLFKPDAGVIGIASWSGNILPALAGQLAEFEFGCSKIVSAANCADLTRPITSNIFAGIRRPR